MKKFKVFINELHGKGSIEKIAAHHVTKLMSSKTPKEKQEGHRSQFQRAVGLGQKLIMKKKKAANDKLRKEETINELSKETLRSYHAHATKHPRVSIVPKQDKRPFVKALQDRNAKRRAGIDKADLRLAGTMNTKQGSKSYHPEETIHEVSKRKLYDYIPKAHISGTGAAADAENAYKNQNRKKMYAANLKGEKRETGIKQAVKKLRGHANVPASEETIHEVHPPGPGFENWVNHRKAEFKKRYGDRWEQVLYATAWKLKNKHPGGI